MTRHHETPGGMPAALLEVAGAMLRADDFRAAARAALDGARELTGARYAALGVLADDGRSLERFLTEGVDSATVRRIGEPPRGRGVLGLLIREPHPIRIDRIGAHPESFGFPLDHPPMSSLLGVPLMWSGQPWGSFYLTDRDGGRPFREQDEHNLAALADLTVGILAPRYALERLRERAEALEDDRLAYSASMDIARSLAGQPDLGHMLELIVKRGRALADARGAVLALPFGDDLVAAAVAGTLSDDLLGERLPVGDRGREPLERGRPVVGEREAGLTGLRSWLEAEATLVVPLRLRNQLVGVLVCIDRTGDGPGFGGRDIALLDGFAASGAVAIATARSAQEQALRRAIAASEHERAHWARELHDQTLQELAAIRLLVGLALRAATDDARVEILDEAVRQIDVAAVELRRIVTELRPATLDANGLRAALDGLADRTAALGGVEIVFDCFLPRAGDGDDERLPPEIEGVVYRVVQEALNNVTRHSGASRVEVRVEVVQGVLAVRVSDDGVGFAPGAERGGFGLIGMRERAELVSGELRVESRPGSGTVVAFTVPVEEADPARIRRRGGG